MFGMSKCKGKIKLRLLPFFFFFFFAHIKMAFLKPDICIIVKTHTFQLKPSVVLHPSSFILATPLSAPEGLKAQDQVSCFG